MASNGQIIGYRRVSTADQNTHRQLDGVVVEQMFEDMASGKDVKRPQFQAMMKHVRSGDTVIVHSLDRMARNLVDLRAVITELTGRGVKVLFVKENLIFSGEDSPMSNLLLNMLGAVAEFERALILERQREGIALAKKAGIYKGRKYSLNADEAKSLLSRIAAGEPKAKLAREFAISRASLYNYMASA